MYTHTLLYYVQELQLMLHAYIKALPQVLAIHQCISYNTSKNALSDICVHCLRVYAVANGNI